jgi:hypothetical protein
LDKVISEILKPLKMVFCSSREIISLKILKNFPSFQYFTADRMSLVSPPVQMAGQPLRPVKLNM